MICFVFLWTTQGRIHYTISYLYHTYPHLIVVPKESKSEREQKELAAYEHQEMLKARLDDGKGRRWDDVWYMIYDR